MPLTADHADLGMLDATDLAVEVWAADIPAAALSPLLGIGIETAVRWTHWAKRDWHAYIQARAVASAAGHRIVDGSAPQP